jgi:hypothetical protein
MDPDPSYRNKVTITGSRTAFERTKRGVNERSFRIAAAYSKEGK